MSKYEYPFIEPGVWLTGGVWHDNDQSDTAVKVEQLLSAVLLDFTELQSKF